MLNWEHDQVNKNINRRPFVSFNIKRVARKTYEYANINTYMENIHGKNLTARILVENGNSL